MMFTVANTSNSLHIPVYMSQHSLIMTHVIMSTAKLLHPTLFQQFNVRFHRLHFFYRFLSNFVKATAFSFLDIIIRP